MQVANQAQLTGGLSPPVFRALPRCFNLPLSGPALGIVPAKHTLLRPHTASLSPPPLHHSVLATSSLSSRLDLTHISPLSALARSLSQLTPPQLLLGLLPHALPSPLPPSGSVPTVTLPKGCSGHIIPPFKTLERLPGAPPSSASPAYRALPSTAPLSPAVPAQPHSSSLFCSSHNGSTFPSRTPLLLAHPLSLTHSASPIFCKRLLPYPSPADTLLLVGSLPSPQLPST